MRCDANAAGCLACQQKSLRCVTTDRITGRATERGQADRLETELIALRRHLAVYVNKYGHLQDTELATSNTYQDVPAAVGYGSQQSQAFDPQNSYSASTRGGDGPYYGPINGTMVDMLDGEVDIAAFDCPAMDDFEYGAGLLFNHSATSYIQTVSGAHRPEKPVMPPKEEALKCMEQFFGTVNTYVPVLHGPSTMALVRQIFTSISHFAKPTRQTKSTTTRSISILVPRKRSLSLSYATCTIKLPFAIPGPSKRRG